VLGPQGLRFVSRQGLERRILHLICSVTVDLGFAQRLVHGQITVGFGKASGLYTWKPVRLSTPRAALCVGMLSTT
jgi:hypothetical protein